MEKFYKYNTYSNNIIKKHNVCKLRRRLQSNDDGTTCPCQLIITTRAN